MGLPLIPIPKTEEGAAQRIKLTKGSEEYAKTIAPGQGPASASMSDKAVKQYNRPGIRTRGSDYSVAREARKE